MGPRSNRPAQPSGDPAPVCVRCQAIAESPVAVCTVHQNSGPGYTIYACRVCAPRLPEPEGER